MKKIFPFLATLTAISVLSSFNSRSSLSDLASGEAQLTTHNSLLTTDTILYPEEKHLKNVQQLTFGGDNAEAYFSFNGKWIIFQRTNPKEGIMCDEMFIGKVPAPGEKFE